MMNQATAIATGHRTISVIPMEGALGAEIEGVDTSKPLSEETLGDIKQALLDYQVLCFRNQDLTPDQHLAFARCFGEIETYPFAEHIPGYPGVVAITKEPGTELNFGGVWHSDSPYMEKPPKATVLYAVDIPPSGGDTMFANMYAAWESLSGGMQALLEGRKGIFSACCVQTNDNLKLGDVIRRKDYVMAMAEQVHPIVRTHPDTFRKSVFISRVHVQRIDGMTEAESAPILDYLAEAAVQPQFTMRLRWQPGSLVIWDNQCIQHYALNDYQGFRREVHRVVLKGDRPF